MKTVLLSALLLLSSCSLVTKLTKDGFNQSTVFTDVDGTTCSVDRKFVHIIDREGNYSRYKVTDPRVKGIVAATVLFPKKSRYRVAVK